MEPKLTGVPETLLIPLWARAVEAYQAKPIIQDEQAVKIMEQLDYDFTRFAKGWRSQIGVVVRTELLDRAVQKFILQHPDATVINIGCGLDTRFSRVDNGRIHWYEVDLPEVIGIRGQFFQANERYRMIAGSVLEEEWLAEAAVDRGPVLIVAEGILMYFTAAEVQRLLGKLATVFPGATMFAEVITPTLVKMSDRHDTVSQLGLRFQWGIVNGADLERLDRRIRWVAEWSYFDYHRRRWRWMGWLALIPAFKQRFNCGIVQIRFE